MKVIKPPLSVSILAFIKPNLPILLVVSKQQQHIREKGQEKTTVTILNAIHFAKATHK